MEGGPGVEEEKKVVLITGCTDGGIGASLSLEFAGKGFIVVACSLSVDTMKELGSHENIHPTALDVRNFEAGKAVVENVVSKYGHIDILINNAGIPCVAPVAELPLSTLENVYRTNVFGPISLIQAVSPHMVARGKGKIVNVGSIVSRFYGPWSGAYTSSKAALEALTDALRLEMKPFGIQVVLILPGAITSNIGKNGSASLQSNILDNLNLYKPFVHELEKRVRLSQSERSTPTKEFAEKVVAQILMKHPPVHYAYGTLTTIGSILFYTPFWIRDYLFSKMFGLDGKISVSRKKVD